MKRVEINMSAFKPVQDISTSLLEFKNMIVYHYTNESITAYVMPYSSFRSYNKGLALKCNFHNPYKKNIKQFIKREELEGLLYKTSYRRKDY